MHDTVNKTKGSATTFRESSGGLDLVGLVMKAGDALKTSLESIGTFTNMVEDSAKMLPLGRAGVLLKDHTISIVIMAVIAGFIAIYVKYRA